RLNRRLQTESTAPIDAQQKVYPMVPPGAANTEMVGE
ncbi:hypothetical protein, partial [Klebsiella pneumoniae]